MPTTLREFYENNGADYDLYLQRLMGKESLIMKYLSLFISDPTFLELQEGIKNNDFDLILKKAHTLKGLTSNINLTILSDLSAEIVNQIRTNQTQYITNTFENLSREYNRIVKEIELLSSAKEN